MHKRGISQSSFENFCLTVLKNFGGERSCLSKKFWCRTISRIRGEGRLSRFSVGVVLSRSTEKFRRGTPPCFRKFLVSQIFMHQRVVSQILSRINKIKKVGKGWDSNPYSALQNLVVVPTVSWEQLEFLVNVSRIMKVHGPTEIRTRTYCVRNFCPHRTAVTIYLKIKIVGKNTLKKNTTLLY